MSPPLDTTSGASKPLDPATFSIILVFVFIAIVIIVFLVLKALKKKYPCLTTVAGVAVVAGVFFGVMKLRDVSNQKKNGGDNNDGNPVRMTRSATNADIDVEEEDIDWHSFGSVYAITALHDIENLSLRITVFTDKKTLGQKTVRVGDIDEYDTHNVTFSVSELSIGLGDILHIVSTEIYWKYEVTGGTVSYFR